MVGDERGPVVEAPPAEVRAALAPVATLEGGDRVHLDGATVVADLLVDGAVQRDLPAHRRLVRHRVLTTAHRQVVQGAALAGGEAVTVGEDASTLDDAGVDLVLVVALQHALAQCAAVELHRLGVEVLADDALELRPVIVLVQVRAMSAATEDRLPGDALAATPEDARVVREEERHVERVATMVVLGVDERDPFAIDHSRTPS